MYYFIINPKSRSGRGHLIWKHVRHYLNNCNIQYRFYYTKHKDHATQITNLLCSTIHTPIQLVVLGGDGTLNEVINGISDFSKVCLSYIPAGSSNDFARSLHISSNPKDALATVLTPNSQTSVDIGELELLDDYGNVTSKRRFVVSCGFGFDAAICYEALNSKFKYILNRIHLGKLTYGLIALKQSLFYQQTQGNLIIDNHKKKHFNNILFLTSMIHKYEGGGAILAPQASYQDQKLSVCFVHNLSPLKTLLLLPTAFFAKHTRFHGVEVFDCSTVDLMLYSQRVVHTDGEYAGMSKHIRVHCVKHTLLVNTPLHTNESI